MPLPESMKHPLRVLSYIALNSNCCRRRVGCVIARPDGMIISCGYNHNPYPGDACPVCPREKYASGDRLDLCHALHAEADAIAHAAMTGLSVAGCTAFVTVFPCPSCTGLLIESGITRIIVVGDYAKASVSQETFCHAGFSVKEVDCRDDDAILAYSFDITRE